MKITSFSFGDKLVGWDFQEIQLKNLNLFVGESASGKSLMLTTMFAICLKAVNDQGVIVAYWHLRFEHAGVTYDWEFDSPPKEFLPPTITKEKLVRFNQDGSQTILIDRTEFEFKLRDEKVPRLAGQSTSIFLLREDPDIKPIYEGFQRIMRRDFAGDELNNSASIQSIQKNTLSTIAKDKSLYKLLNLNLTVSSRLAIMKEYFNDRYKAVVSHYRDVFPFVEQFEFKDMSESGALQTFAGKMPYLHMKDRKSGTLVPLQQLSSGMKKVLLIMTDVMSLPDGMVYLIDEYENSLGLNAINFLPTLIAEHGGGNQFIITSHHPYLINAIPVENWIVFHRNGLKVSVKQGGDLVESYGKSKQQSFIKLINDPFFTEGVA